MPNIIELADSTLQSTRPLFEIVGIEPSAYEDPLNIMISILLQVVTPDADGEKLTHDMLLEIFQSIEGIFVKGASCKQPTALMTSIVSNSVVFFLRLLTSAQIRAELEKGLRIAKAAESARAPAGSTKASKSPSLLKPSFTSCTHP